MCVWQSVCGYRRISVTAKLLLLSFTEKHLIGPGKVYDYGEFTNTLQRAIVSGKKDSSLQKKIVFLLKMKLEGRLPTPNLI